ncbi:MAG: ExbD/TolR family protein [Acidobacteriota bacterium]
MRYRVKKIAPSVPTASMADIAFLLIIFFMLTTSFSPERTNVKLPKSEIQTEVAKGSAIVAITEDGTIHYTDGEAPSFELSGAEELGLQTRELVKLAPNKEFLIKADRLVRYKQVDEVLEQLRNNGAKNIGLLTRRRAPRETK